MSKVVDIHLIGLDSAKPTADSTNNGYYYTSTDVAGGTTYRSNGSTWVQIAAGASGSHAAVTVSDTATVDLTLSGQALSADVLPGGIKLDDLGAPDNNTDLNASASAHGLLPKLDNTGSKFLRDDGSWQSVDTTTTGGIPQSLIDAKGDLIAGTAADTAGRLAVGANETVLMADSSQATGLKWSDTMKDSGFAYTVTWGVSGAPFTSTDQHSAAAAVTDAPTAGQKLVIVDLIISVDTAMLVTFTEETSGTVIDKFYMAANSSAQITLRGKKKLATADKKLLVQTSVAGNIVVDCGYYSEA